MASLVSVIIPTYNRAKLLVEAMDSILTQSYRPIEIIVVDDGSSDATRSVVEDWRSRHADGRDIEVCYHYQRNSGAPSARNRGVAVSRGEYVLFLDSDDILCPRKLTEQILALAPDYDACVAGTLWIDAQSTATDRRQDVPPSDRSEDPLDDFLRGKIRPWPTVWLFRRSSLLGTPPWDDSMRVWEDIRFIFGFLINSRRVRYIPKALSMMREHEGMRVSSREYSPEGLMVIGQYFADAAHMLVQTGRGNRESRRIFAGTMMRYAIQLWGVDRHMCLQLCDYARKLDGHVQPSVGLVGQIGWRLGGIHLTGFLWQIRRLLKAV